MPDCFCVPDAGAKCSSARAVTGASTTARRAAAASLGVNRCAGRDAGIRRHRKVCTQNYVKHPPVGIYARIFGG